MISENHNMIIFRHNCCAGHFLHMGFEISRKRLVLFIQYHIVYFLTFVSCTVITIMYTPCAPHTACYCPHHILLNSVIVMRIFQIFFSLSLYRISICIFSASISVHLNASRIKLIIIVIQGFSQ